MVNGLRFSNQWPLKALYNAVSHSLIHAHSFIHTSSSSGAVRVWHLSHGRLDIQLGGTRDRTSNFPVTSLPALPPVPQAPQRFD